MLLERIRFIRESKNCLKPSKQIKLPIRNEIVSLSQKGRDYGDSMPIFARMQIIRVVIKLIVALNLLITGNS